MKTYKVGTYVEFEVIAADEGDAVNRVKLASGIPDGTEASFHPQPLIMESNLKFMVATPRPVATAHAVLIRALYSHEVPSE